MISYFYRALDVLAPLARQVGTRLFIENMPFAFLPDAESLMNAVDGYGDDSIRVIYDVANAHFIGEAPTDGLRRVRDRLSLVHFSDTTRQSYKHDPLGCGDVPLAGIASVMKEIGYTELPMLEVISLKPDSNIADSCRRLQQADQVALVIGPTGATGGPIVARHGLEPRLCRRGSFCGCADRRRRHAIWNVQKQRANNGGD